MPQGMVVGKFHMVRMVSAPLNTVRKSLRDLAKRARLNPKDDRRILNKQFRRDLDDKQKMTLET